MSAPPSVPALIIPGLRLSNLDQRGNFRQENKFSVRNWWYRMQLTHSGEHSCRDLAGNISEAGWMKLGDLLAEGRMLQWDVMAGE